MEINPSEVTKIKIKSLILLKNPFTVILKE